MRMSVVKARSSLSCSSLWADIRACLHEERLLNTQEIKTKAVKHSKCVLSRHRLYMHNSHEWYPRKELVRQGIRHQLVTWTYPIIATHCPILLHTSYQTTLLCTTRVRTVMHEKYQSKPPLTTACHFSLTVTRVSTLKLCITYFNVYRSKGFSATDLALDQ